MYSKCIYFAKIGNEKQKEKKEATTENDSCLFESYCCFCKQNQLRINVFMVVLPQNTINKYLKPRHYKQEGSIFINIAKETRKIVSTIKRNDDLDGNIHNTTFFKTTNDEDNKCIFLYLTFRKAGRIITLCEKHVDVFIGENYFNNMVDVYYMDRHYYQNVYVDCILQGRGGMFF